MIDVLEKEGYIVPSRIPTACIERVLVSGPRSYGRMIKAGEVVVVTMDDNGGGLYFTGMVSIGGLATNGQGETERKETDAAHEGEDDTEKANLLSPCPLLFWCSHATGSEERWGNAASDGKAIKEPTVFRTRTEGIQPTAILPGGLWIVDARIYC